MSKPRLVNHPAIAKNPPARSISNYLDATSLKVSRYLAASHHLADEINVVQSASRRPRVSEINAFVKSQESMQVGLPRSSDDGDAGGMVDIAHPGFKASIGLVQSEIAGVIAATYPEEKVNHYGDLDRLLRSDPDDLESLFGSVSRAWDCLVETKQKLTVPDGFEFAAGGWLVSVVSETERLIRETVALSYVHFGSSLLRDTLLRSFEALEIEVAIEDLLSYPDTSEAVAQIAIEHMSRHSGETLDAASYLADSLGVDFLPDSAGFKPGANDLVLASVGGRPVSKDRASRRTKSLSETERLFKSLIEWRRQIIHSSMHGDPVSSLRPQLPLFSASKQQLSFIADFLGAVGLSYCLTTTEALLRRSGPVAAKDEVSNRVWKVAAELRVEHLEMLKLGRWSLAWSCALPISQIGDSERQDMPLLNGYFACSQLDGGTYWRSEKKSLQEFSPSSSRPRYEVLKKSILGDRTGIASLLNRAVEESDLTLAELEEWPALENLRSMPQFATWRKRRFGL